PRAKRGKIKRLFPNERAELVRDLFERYAAGECGLKIIAADLNARGVPSANGRAWGASSVRRILTNEVYLGHTLYNRDSVAIHATIRADGAKRLQPADKAERRKRFADRPRKRKRNAKVLLVHNDDKDVIRRESTHEAIVSPELFARVQAV